MNPYGIKTYYSEYQEQIELNKELLEALKEVVRISDRKHNAWDKAKTAITKAEQQLPIK